MSIIVASPPICVSGVGPVSVSLDGSLRVGELGGDKMVLLACLLVFSVGEAAVAVAFPLVPLPPDIEVGGKKQWKRTK